MADADAEAAAESSFNISLQFANTSVQAALPSEGKNRTIARIRGFCVIPHFVWNSVCGEDSFWEIILLILSSPAYENYFLFIKYSERVYSSLTKTFNLERLFICQFLLIQKFN